MSNAPASNRSLKEEGNALFSQKDFSGAYLIYTAAIEQDASNPILYANRAACLLPLRRFPEAREDSLKAVELDPSYTKAWGRLATANEELGDLTAAMEAYKKGLSTIDATVSELTSSQNEMKKDLEARLEVIEKRYTFQKNNLILQNEWNAGDSPWERAKAMIPDLIECQRTGDDNGAMSCAWIVNASYQNFSAGVKKLNNIKEITSPDGQVSYDFEPGALRDLVSGFIIDRRVFHMHGEGWLEKLDRQIHLELEKSGALAMFPDSIENVVIQVQERIRDDGWEYGASDAVMAIVCAWFLRAFTASSLCGEYDVALEFYGKVIGFLERCRPIWVGIPTEKRIEVIESHFLNAVRGLYLHTFYRATPALDGKPGDASEYTVRALLSLSQGFERDMKLSLNDIAREPDKISHLTSLLAYYLYPLGQALSIQGACYKELAKEAREHESLRSMMKKSFDAYMEAAKVYYPQDDEHYAACISSALDGVLAAGAPLKVALPFVNMLKACVPKMLRIWEHSAAVTKLGNRQAHYEYVFEWEATVREELNAGRADMESVIMPNWVEVFPIMQTILGTA